MPPATSYPRVVAWLGPGTGTIDPGKRHACGLPPQHGDAMVAELAIHGTNIVLTYNVVKITGEAYYPDLTKTRKEMNALREKWDQMSQDGSSTRSKFSRCACAYSGAVAGSNGRCSILSRDRCLQVRLHDSFYPAYLRGGVQFLDGRFPFPPGIPQGFQHQVRPIPVPKFE